MRREFPENRVIIPTSGLKFGRAEEAFLSSEDFLPINHQRRTNLDKQGFQLLRSLSDIELFPDLL